MSDDAEDHDFGVPIEECMRDRGFGRASGVPIADESWDSLELAHARKTVSRMAGVKRERVCCDSLRAARRRRFF